MPRLWNGQRTTAKQTAKEGETVMDAIVTDITCSVCDFKVVIDKPERGLVGRQIRTEWFEHMRLTHPETYARFSPAFADAFAERQSRKAEQATRTATKHRLSEKRAMKGVE
jgi:hypothetical protein